MGFHGIEIFVVVPTSVLSDQLLGMVFFISSELFYRQGIREQSEKKYSEEKTNPVHFRSVMRRQGPEIVCFQSRCKRLEGIHRLKKACEV